MKNKTKYLVAILLMLVSFLLIGATNVNAKTITVEDEEELINASRGIDSEINEIKLTKDITLTKFLNFYVVNDITLELNGQTLDIGSYGLSFNYGQSDYDESNNKYYYNFNSKLTIKDSSSSKTGKILSRENIFFNYYDTNHDEEIKKFGLTIDGGYYEEGEGGADIRPDEGDGDLEELGQAARTVQIGALVQADGYGRHGGHVHDHVVADGLPHHGNDDGGDDQFFALPQDGVAHVAEQADDAVQHTVFRLIDGREDTGDDDYRQDVGDVEDDPEEILSLDLFPGQDGRKHQRKGKGDDGHYHHQQDHILHGADELGILEQVLEILQAHKGLVGRVGTALVQAHAEHVEGGQDHKEEKQDGSRCHTEEYEPFAAFIRSHRGLTAPFLMVLYSPKKRRR